MQRPDSTDSPEDAKPARAVRALTSLVAHAFAGPVLTMRHAAQAVVARYPDDPEVQGVVASAMRLEILLDGLTRLQAVERTPFPEVVDLDAALRSALRRVRAHDHHPDVRASPLGHVVADEAQLVSILTELLTNVALHCHGCPRVLVHAMRREAFVELLLADTGPGLPTGIDRAAPRLFSRIGLDHSTAGCGLAICAALADVNGGSLQLDDGPAGGTVVRVMLPAGDP
jgi:two-component system sensor histidine kinase KdpD